MKRTRLIAAIMTATLLASCAKAPEQTSVATTEETTTAAEETTPTTATETSEETTMAETTAETTVETSAAETEAEYEPVEIFTSENGMPRFSVDDGELVFADDSYPELQESLTEEFEYNNIRSCMVYRADSKVFSVKGTCGSSTEYYNYNLAGEEITLRDVLYDFPASCEDVILEELEFYHDQYAALWGNDFEMSEVDYDSVDFLLDANSVVVYINKFPYRIYYADHADIINPDILPDPSAEMFAVYKRGTLQCADGTMLNFNYIEPTSSMEDLSLSVDGTEVRELDLGEDRRRRGFADAIYYYDGNGGQYISIYTQGWTDSDLGQFLLGISDGSYWFILTEYSNLTDRSDPNDIAAVV
jgi:hypothetical protein